MVLSFHSGFEITGEMHNYILDVRARFRRMHQATVQSDDTALITAKVKE